MVIIDGYPFDLMVSGELSFSAEVTSFSVERNSNISDHIRPQPVELTLELVVSNTPIGELAADPSRQVQAQNALNFLGLSGLTDVIDLTPLPSAEAYTRLVQIRDEKRTVTVEIPVASKTAKPGRRVFKNMALTDITERHAKETSGGGFFTITFKQIRIVDNRKILVRTATPSGQGKRTPQVKVGQAHRVDTAIHWIFGFSTATVDLQYSDGRGAPGSKTTYRWAEPYSPEFPFKVKPGQQLDKPAEIAFKKYLGDEARIKNQTQAQVLQEGLGPELGRIDLPDGMDTSRLQAPESEAARAPATSITHGRGAGRPF